MTAEYYPLRTLLTDCLGLGESGAVAPKADESGPVAIRQTPRPFSHVDERPPVGAVVVQASPQAGLYGLRRSVDGSRLEAGQPHVGRSTQPAGRASVLCQFAARKWHRQRLTGHASPVGDRRGHRHNSLLCRSLSLPVGPWRHCPLRALPFRNAKVVGSTPIVSTNTSSDSRATYVGAPFGMRALSRVRCQFAASNGTFPPSQGVLLSMVVLVMLLKRISLLLHAS